jgi:hypothetical protein
MRQHPLLVALLVSACLLSACIEKTEYDALQQKLNNATKELAEAKESSKKSQDQLTDLQAHRYQSVTNGGRTWRFDTAKGKSCILLTSDQDWKSRDTKKQSCNCEDFYRDVEYPIIEGQTSEEFKLYEARVKLFEARARNLGCE